MRTRAEDDVADVVHWTDPSERTGKIFFCFFLLLNLLICLSNFCNNVVNNHVIKTSTHSDWIFI